MDVVLIQPRHRISRAPARRGTLPLGLLSVATPLDVAGYEVRIIDQQAEHDWESSLLAELKTGPICVGVTSMTGPQIWWAVKASRVVKENSAVPVVWGGVHASLLPEQTLESPYIDIVVQGEGEETFFELVEALHNRRPLHAVRGISYKESGCIKSNPPRPFIDLNEQPPLSYHLVDMRGASRSERDAPLFETSRGCPFDCAFCYNTSLSSREWRALSPEQTLLRLRRLVDEVGIKRIAFSDDNLFTDLDRTHRILEGMVRQELNVVWGKGDVRLDTVSRLDDGFLDLIERSGCVSLVIGVESGSQRIADILRKDIDVSQAVPVNRRLAGYEMGLRYLFMLGIPGETKSDMAETASLILRLKDENPKAASGVQIYIPYPGTELFDLCMDYGLDAPQGLEEWIPFGWSNRRVDYPWWPGDGDGLLRMLSFCNHFIQRRSTIYPDTSILGSFVSRVYSPIARRRMRGLNHSFMPELRIAELLGFKGY